MYIPVIIIRMARPRRVWPSLTDGKRIAMSEESGNGETRPEKTEILLARWREFITKANARSISGHASDKDLSTAIAESWLAYALFATSMEKYVM